MTCNCESDSEETVTDPLAVESAAAADAAAAAAAAAAAVATAAPGRGNERLVRSEGALGARNTSDGGAVMPRPRAPPVRFGVIDRGRVRDESVCTFEPAPAAAGEATLHEVMSRSEVEGRGSSLRTACNEERVTYLKRQGGVSQECTSGAHQTEGGVESARHARTLAGLVIKPDFHAATGEQWQRLCILH